MVEPRRSLGRLVMILAGGNIIASILRMLGGLFTARLVEPAVLGVFNGMGLVLGYLPFLQLGIMNGLARELPYHVGRGEQGRAMELSAAGQAWALLLGCLTLSVFLALGAWHALHGAWQNAAGWASYGVGGWLLFYGTYYLEITYRTSGDFARLSFVTVVQAVCGVLLLVAVWLLDFYGLCLRFLAVGLIGFGLLWHFRPVRVRPRFSFLNLKHLLRVGAPIFFVAQISTWWTVLNHTAILKFIGTKGFGMFALSIIATDSLSIIPIAVIQVTYPKIAQLYGETGRIRPLIEYLWRPTALLVLGMVPITVIAWVLLPPVARLALPRYVEGIPAAQWGILVAFLFSFHSPNSVFIAVGKIGYYLVAIVTGMLVHGVALFLLLRNRTALECFPQAMIVGRIAFLLLCYLLLARLWRQDGETEGAIRSEGEPNKG